ncbi:MAG: hypothetical protein WBN90_10070 [Gammaproteobacteria bacterium]
MEPLNLSVPRQHDFTDPRVERNIKRLRGWLTGLPLMDVVETIRLVLNALDALNEQKMDVQSRFDSLEAFHVTVQGLFVTLDPVHLRQLSLSIERREQAIEGVERLLLSLAAGYKLVVITLHKGQASGKLDKLFGLAVNRSIETLVYTLLDCFRFYRATQPCYYLELHQLYRLARHHGLMHIKPDDAGEDHSAATASTADLYHTGMLAALMDPFRLAEGEISVLFEVLSQHAEHCRIIPGRCQPGDGEGRYQIDLGSDRMPVSCIDLEPSAVVEEPYILDITKVLESAREQLQQVPDKVRMLSPEAMLLRQLSPEDQKLKQRAEKRHAITRRAQLLRGIGSIHDFLVRPSLKEVLGQAARGKSPSMVKPYQCQVLDSSENGMRLSWVNNDDSDVRVGDLLAVVQGEPGEEYLQLAILRSVHVFRQGAMDAGVMLIKGGVGAVYCYFPGESPSRGSSALFVTTADDEQGAATLVAAKGIYEEGRRLSIDIADKHINVRAGRLIFNGPVFDRFEFSAE